MKVIEVLVLSTLSYMTGTARADLPLMCSIGNDGSVIAQVTNTTGIDQHCTITCSYVDQAGANQTYRCQTSVSNGVYNFVSCELRGANARRQLSQGTINCSP
jgi:hypothetical protein